MGRKKLSADYKAYRATILSQFALHLEKAAEARGQDVLSKFYTDEACADDAARKAWSRLKNGESARSYHSLVDQADRADLTQPNYDVMAEAKRFRAAWDTYRLEIGHVKTWPERAKSMSVLLDACALPEVHVPALSGYLRSLMVESEYEAAAQSDIAERLQEQTELEAKEECERYFSHENVLELERRAQELIEEAHQLRKQLGL